MELGRGGVRRIFQSDKGGGIATGGAEGGFTASPFCRGTSLFSFFGGEEQKEQGGRKISLARGAREKEI